VAVPVDLLEVKSVGLYNQWIL